MAFTQALHAAAEGDASARTHLWGLIYDELRRVAHGQLRRERADHTLSTTALVHEAYLRMSGPAPARLQDRGQFMAMAARVMRHVLVDYARQRRAQKRGGGQPLVAFDEDHHLPAARADELIALDEALARLGQQHTRLGRIIECCYFGGLTQQETAEALGLSLRTVERDWKKARGWLYRELVGARPRPAPATP